MKATPACGYSADTEILTRHQGWVTFDRLTYLDEVATRSPDGEFRWQHPERITWQPYSGEMVRFHGRSMDLLVTPSQSLLCAPDPRSCYRVTEAEAVLAHAPALTRPRAATYFTATSRWEAPDLPAKVFAGIQRSRHGPKPRDVHMTGDQFAAFMGMYIAEGSATPAVHDWLVAISQSAAGKGYEEYRALLTDIFASEPGRTSCAWVLHSRALYEYLRPLGKAASKYLPAEILNLSRRQLEIFWRYYFLGDGNYECRNARYRDTESVATASPVLAGQLQEIVQKLGFCGSVRRYLSKGNAMIPGDRWIYKLRIRRTMQPACGVTRASYAGMIGGASVPNGVAYMRRGGHPAWCGAI